MADESILEKARALSAVMREHAARGEREARVADEVIDAMESSGLLGLFAPKLYGGLEEGPATMLEVVSILGEGDASAAWVASFYMAHTWIAALFPKEAQDELFAGRAHLRAPAPFAPTGVLTARDGGYSLTGNWRFATGCVHGTWAFVGAIEPGEPRPRFFLVAVPRADYEIVETWDVDGMAGTGSHDITVSDAFVPAHRTISLNDFRTGNTPGTKVHAGPLYRVPMPPMLALTAAAPVIGAARRGHQEYARQIRQRILAYEGTSQVDKPAAQMRLAAAEADIRAAELLLESSAGELMQLLSGTKEVTLDDRSRLRLNAAYAVQCALRALRGLADSAGSSAHFASHPLQRQLRDVTVVATHAIFDWDQTTELRGRMLVGLKPSSPLL